MDNVRLFKVKTHNDEWIQGSLNVNSTMNDININTFCPYTGFEDINNCEIFLNDIVRFEDDYNNEYFGCIKFNSDFNVYIIEPKNPICFIEECNWSTLNNLEVIGNVFDNTEW